MKRLGVITGVVLVLGMVWWVLPVAADSIIIEMTDASWHTGSVCEHLTCTDGYIEVSCHDWEGKGEVGGWARFDTSAIPDDALVTEVGIYFCIDTVDDLGPYVDFKSLAHDPLDVSCAQIWQDLKDGFTYIDNGHLGTTGWCAANLQPAAAQDLQALLPQDWFAVGFEHDDRPYYWAYIGGHQHAYPPYLVVTYAVDPPPDPDLVAVSGIPSEVLVGESFTVQVTAENDGGPSTEGMINASVLYSDGTADVTLDQAAAAWAVQPVGLYAPGEGPLYDAACVQLPGGAVDNAVQAVDNYWDYGDNQTLSFRVTPHKAGTLWVRTRATMAGEGTCTYYNDHSVGGPTSIDQQGWETVRFAVKVNAPPALDLHHPSEGVVVDQGEPVLLQWSDSDPDDNAAISLAYDVDDDPENGIGHTWITQDLYEDLDGTADQSSWDTSSVPFGTYYVWGVIDDGRNPQLYSRAPGWVTIEDPSLYPALTYASYTIDDNAAGDSSGNGDGVANCGEALELYVTLKNQGTETAQGVNVAIDTADPYVTWLYNRSSAYPNISIGGWGTNGDDFDLLLDSDMPDGHWIHFDIDITAANGGPWSDDFAVPVTCIPNHAPYPPDNPSPVDGATDQEIDLTLHWTGGDPDAGDHVRYDVLLEADDATPDVLACNDITVTTCDPGALAYGRRYFWRVVAVDDRGASTPGPVWDFYTVCPLPAAPDLTSPTDDAVTCSGPPIFAWSPVSSALSYTLQVAEDADFDPLVIAAATDAPTHTPETPLPPGSYSWRVRATSMCGDGPWSPVWNLTVLAPPAAPALSLPSDTSIISDTTPYFAWSSVQDVVSYALQVDDDLTFSSPEIGVETADTDYTPLPSEALVYGRDYAWRARASNACGYGPWSPSWQFTLLSVPDAPLLLLPADTSALSDTTPHFAWSAVDGAASYRLQVAAHPTFNTWDVDLMLPDTDYVLPPASALSPGSAYVWRVRAWNVVGYGPWSDVWHVMILPEVPGVDTRKVYLPVVLK